MAEAGTLDTDTAHAVAAVQAGWEARGVWAMFDYVEFKPSRGIRGYGHYHEEYRKEAGKWHISKLKLTRLRVDSLG